MKDGWMNLSLREKQTVALGSIALFVILIYLLIWSPLSHKIISLRTEVQRGQTTLHWMTIADQEIQIIEKNTEKTHAAHTAASLLSLAQHEINKSPLAKNLSQLRQSDNDSVQLTFQRVNFDNLVAWLTERSQQQNLVVTQAAIKQTGAPGIVTAELVLSQ